jgi:hypothetical protein
MKENVQLHTFNINPKKFPRVTAGCCCGRSFIHTYTYDIYVVCLLNILINILYFWVFEIYILFFYNKKFGFISCSFWWFLLMEKV